MAVIKTNVLSSITYHLDPKVFDVNIPLTLGVGVSDVFEVGRYNEMAIMAKTPGDWGPTADPGQITFQAGLTGDGNFTDSIRFGGSEAASGPLALRLQGTGSGVVIPCWYLLGSRGFGGGASSADDLRGFMAPFMRFSCNTDLGQGGTIQLTVMLKMY